MNFSERAVGMKTPETYVLSIETDAGTYQHGFHLGTEPATAQQIAEEAFESWTPKIGTTIRSVAVKKDGKLWTYDGEWSAPWSAPL